MSNIGREWSRKVRGFVVETRHGTSLFVLLVLISFSGCVDYLEGAADPCFEMYVENEGELVTATTAEVGETVSFKACSHEATHYVIWTGDEGHQYSQKEEGDLGDAVGGYQGIYEYAYSQAGTYEVTWIATVDFLDMWEQAIATKTIVINE